jgi:hypothetical protein
LKKQLRWVEEIKSATQEDEYRAVDTVTGCFHIMAQSPTTDIRTWLTRQSRRKKLSDPARAVKSKQGRRAIAELVALTILEIKTNASFWNEIDVGLLPVNTTGNAKRLIGVLTRIQHWIESLGNDADAKDIERVVSVATCCYSLLVQLRVDADPWLQRKAHRAKLRSPRDLLRTKDGRLALAEFVEWTKTEIESADANCVLDGSRLFTEGSWHVPANDAPREKEHHEPSELPVSAGPLPVPEAVTHFLMHCCEIRDCYSTSSSRLYDGFVTWCKQNGHTPATITAFGRQLNQFGFQMERKSGGKFRQRIRLLPLSTVHVQSSSAGFGPNIESFTKRTVHANVNSYGVGACGEERGEATISPQSQQQQQVTAASEAEPSSDLETPKVAHEPLGDASAGPPGRPACINLRERFGERYEITHDPAYDPELDASEEAWLQQIPCEHGLIWPYGGDLLGVSVDKPNPIVEVVRRLPFVTVRQEGDDGINASFPVEHFDAIAKIMKPRRFAHGLRVVA